MHTTEPHIQKFILVPARRDGDGKFIPHHNATPHGYHHILKVFPDNSYWLEATLSGTVSMTKARKILRVIADNVRSCTEVDFYKNLAQPK